MGHFTSYEVSHVFHQFELSSYNRAINNLISLNCFLTHRTLSAGLLSRSQIDIMNPLYVKELSHHYLRYCFFSSFPERQSKTVQSWLSVVNGVITIVVVIIVLCILDLQFLWFCWVSPTYFCVKTLQNLLEYLIYFLDVKIILFYFKKK